MFLEIVFAIYALLLISLTIVLGFNFVRIGTQLELNPRIITVLLPLLINVTEILFSLYSLTQCSDP